MEATPATDRGTVPIVATLGLLVVVLLAATVVGTFAIGLADSMPQASSATDVVEDPIEVAVDGRTIEVEHTGSEPIDVEELRIEVDVDDEPLAFQPPVPFFSATGFEPGPTGPFNAASDRRWEPGETASIAIAETNEPVPEPGSTVRVTVYLDGQQYGADSDRV